MKLRRSGFKPGDLVVVKSAAAIMATLDGQGCREGMPFMPEMLAYCGRCFPVWRKIESVCEERSAMRCLRHMVLLDDLRCDGRGHDGCDKGCRIFWHEDWLTPLDRATAVVDTPVSLWPYPVREGEHYFCQSTALHAASRPAGRINPRVMFLDWLNRTWSLYRLARFLLVALHLKARRLIHQKPLMYGDRAKTESPALHLQPGEWVRVKSRAEIVVTLDRRGRNRGLEYSRFMLPLFERRFRVLGPVRRIIREDNSRMQEIRNTVILEGASCDGHSRCGGCPRDQFHLWRECWLERVPAPSCAKPVRAVHRGGARLLNDDAWDALVDDHPAGTIYHTSGWRKAMEATFPGLRGFQFGLNREGGGMSIYLSESRWLGRRLLNAPFAMDCGPLLSTDDSMNLHRFTRDVMRHFGARRFELRSVGRLPPGWPDDQASTRVVWKVHRLELTAGVDALHRGLSRTNVRQRIRRARESGIRIVYGASAEQVCEFYLLFAATRRRLGLPVLPASLFWHLVSHLPEGATRLSLAMRDGHPVAGLFAVRCKDTLRYEFSGYHPEAGTNGANQLLWWDGIERACAEGLREVCLGCTAPSNQGLLAYKRHWGGREQDMLTSVLPVRDAAAARPDAMRDWKEHELLRGFFARAPELIYRAASRAVYRHWR
jgi:CelD/BcsL family acetyltransferase involved in cellulose biosynthesis